MALMLWVHVGVHKVTVSLNVIVLVIAIADPVPANCNLQSGDDQHEFPAGNHSCHHSSACSSSQTVG